MIKPDPESNLALNLLVLGSEVIKLLKNEGSPVVIEELMSECLKGETQRTPELIMSTLTLLFALGLIENEGYKVRLRKRDDFTQLRLF